MAMMISGMRIAGSGKSDCTRSVRQNYKKFAILSHEIFPYICTVYGRFSVYCKTVPRKELPVAGDTPSAARLQTMTRWSGSWPVKAAGYGISFMMTET